MEEAFERAVTKHEDEIDISLCYIQSPTTIRIREFDVRCAGCVNANNRSKFLCAHDKDVRCSKRNSSTDINSFIKLKCRSVNLMKWPLKIRNQTFVLRQLPQNKDR